jgi:hypothetical protein
MPVFSFLNPAFLAALPVAALPVIIHLLSRRRLPEVSFPTTQFLRALEPREIRRLRLREVLLLVLRTLALLLLVLVFARPSLTPRNAVTHAAAAVSVVLDDSESMGALDEEARPRIEQAKERAAAIVDAARPGDELHLVTATRPDGPGGGHATDRVRAKRVLAQLEASSLPAALPAAFEAARRALERSRLRARELYVVSDMQQTNFTPEARAQLAAAADGGVRVYLVPLASGRTPNHALEDVDPDVRPGPEGRGLELRARLANHADAPSDRIAIRVRRGDALIGGGDASLRAGEARWAAMPLEPRGLARDGNAPLSVVVEADADALPADDRWYAVLGAPHDLRVLRISEAREGGAAPRFASMALDPGRDGSGGISVEEGSPAALLSVSAARADVVLLDDVASLSTDAEARLRAFVRDGGGLVVALGPRADPAYYSTRLFPGLLAVTLLGVEQAGAGSPFELKARLPSHAALEGFAVGVGASLTQSRVTGLVRGRADSPDVEVVVQTTGGLPVLVAASGVSALLTSLSDDWGELPYSGAYVPLVRGMVAHAARAGRSSERAGGRVGSPPSARLAAPPPGVLLVHGPSGYTSQASVEAVGTAYRATADASALLPGFYHFESNGRVLATASVNVDPIESDLVPIPADSLRAGAGSSAAEDSPVAGPSAVAGTLGTAGALTAHLHDTRRGKELWMGFLIAAAVVLAGELMLGSSRVLKP